MKVTRREFGRDLSLAAAAYSLPSQATEARLPIAFSTLACPAWNWNKVLDYAAAHRFSAIELRGLEGNLDLTSHPIFAPTRIAQTRREIRSHGCRIACVSSSAHMAESDTSKRKEQLSDARRFINLAAELAAPYVRVFSSGTSTEEAPAPDTGLQERVASGLKELGDYAASYHVTVLVETHDNMVTSKVVRDVLQSANSSHVGLLWDAYHTFADGKEDPEFTVGQLGKWIRHTHLKDSVVDGKERKYVLTGRGDVPIERQIAALKKVGYKGVYCFEWEKVWHPDLIDPEIAVGDYAEVVTRYLAKTVK